MLDRLERAAALFARWRFAIERVLADVEVKRRKIRVHESRKDSDDACIVEIRIGLSYLPMKLGEAMEHQPLQLAHFVKPDRVLFRIMRQRAEHPADRVAQLAVIVADAFEDFRADALIVGIIDASDPKAQDVGARLLDHVLREGLVAERLRL